MRHLLAIAFIAIIFHFFAFNSLSDPIVNVTVQNSDSKAYSFHCTHPNIPDMSSCEMAIDKYLQRFEAIVSIDSDQNMDLIFIIENTMDLNTVIQILGDFNSEIDDPADFQFN